MHLPLNILKRQSLLLEVQMFELDYIRMGLTNNLAEISVDFDIYGLKNDQWENL